MTMKMVIVSLALLIAMFGHASRAEEAPQASLPYRSVCEAALLGAADISATTNPPMEVALRSRRANVRLGDIRAWIDAKSGRTSLNIATNGVLSIPLTQELWNENPQIVVNQPRGSMEMAVYLPKGLALQDALARSAPHDASLPPPETSLRFGKALTAEGANWTVTVRWNPGDLHRFVTWQEGEDGFSLGIPLRNRGKPFELSWAGVTMTRYGPYQPACVHHRNGSDWHVQMSHERADFPSDDQLKRMLAQHIPGRPHDRPVLSPDGTMVTLRGPAYSGGDTLDVQIWMLTVNGKKPSMELLKPFVTGKVTEEPNNGTEPIR